MMMESPHHRGMTWRLKNTAQRRKSFVSVQREGFMAGLYPSGTAPANEQSDFHVQAFFLRHRHHSHGGPGDFLDVLFLRIADGHLGAGLGLALDGGHLRRLEEDVLRN